MYKKNFFLNIFLLYLRLREKCIKVLQGLFSARKCIISCGRVIQSLFTVCAEPHPCLQDIIS